MQLLKKKQIKNHTLFLPTKRIYSHNTKFPTFRQSKTRTRQSTIIDAPSTRAYAHTPDHRNFTQLIEYTSEAIEKGLSLSLSHTYTGVSVYLFTPRRSIESVQSAASFISRRASAPILPSWAWRYHRRCAPMIFPRTCCSGLPRCCVCMHFPSPSRICTITRRQQHTHFTRTPRPRTSSTRRTWWTRRTISRVYIYIYRNFPICAYTERERESGVIV